MDHSPGQRHRFEPCDGIYLLSHSVGRPPAGVGAALHERFLQPWFEGHGEPWPEWLEAIETFRAALGECFHSAAANFCPQTNLSGSLVKIIGALPAPTERRVLLLSEDDFPSMGFVLQQAQRRGYELRYLPRAQSVVDLDHWDAQLTDDVALALLTHAQSNTSRRTPVAEVAALARTRGVLTVVDVAQSAGVVPIDADAWDADFIVGSCVKWLCGGPGAGFLWVNPAIIERCTPEDVGWFSHAEPFEFDIHRFRYHGDALRFWGGTPSVLPFVVADAGIRTLLEIGIDAVHAHNQRLVQRVVDAVPPEVLRSPAHADQRGGTLVLDFAERAEGVIGRLQRSQVRFDARAFGIRLSPHIYNTDAEIDAVLACLMP